MTTRLRALSASSATTAGTVPTTPRHHHLTACSSHLPVLSQLASLGVSLDVISGGREAVRSSRLARLAEATGGAIIIEDDFGASFSANLAIAARRPTRRDAVLSVRASSGVGCARVIGAAEAMRPEEAAAATATGSGGGDGAAIKRKIPPTRFV